METKVNCFLCEKDITNSEKVLSFFSFPDKLWDETTRNWDKDFRKLFNRALCSSCAKIDLEIAHEKHKLKSHRKKWDEELVEKDKETARFHRLFSRIYIKI